MAPSPNISLQAISAIALDLESRSNGTGLVAHALLIKTDNGILLVEPVLDYPTDDVVYSGVSIVGAPGDSLEEAETLAVEWREQRGFKSPTSKWEPIGLSGPVDILLSEITPSPKDEALRVFCKNGMLTITGC